MVLDLGEGFLGRDRRAVQEVRPIRIPLRVGNVIVAADGTGDYDNIQDGINDLPPNGGTVTIKEGTYVIKNPPLTILKSSVTLQGAGIGTLIRPDAGTVPANGIIIDIGNNSDQFNDIYIKDVKITGTTDASDDPDAIRVRKVENFNCINVVFRGITSGFDATIILSANCEFARLDNIFMDEGVLEVEGDDTIITNIRTSSGEIDIAADRCIVSNCIISSDDNISIDGDNCIVMGNILRNADNTAGVYLKSGADKNMIMGNIIKDGASGVHIGDLGTCVDNVVVGNICTGNSRYGIEIEGGSSDDNILIANQLEGNTLGGYKNTDSSDLEIGHNVES